MPAFIESPRFPEAISYGSAGGPGFLTYVFEGHSGFEQRNAAWQLAKARWTISVVDRDAEEMDVIRAFFYACRGRLIGFRFKDWNDFVVGSVLTPAPLAAVGAANVAVKLIKVYAAGSSTYTRRIVKPIAGTFRLFADGVAIATALEGVNYTVDYAQGIFTVTPAAGATLNGRVLTYTCEFDCPVRFDTDNLTASQVDYATQTWSSIPIVELPADFVQ
jgi:uncharacterized protein (TIGR02217 family)